MKHIWLRSKRHFIPLKWINELKIKIKLLALKMQRGAMSQGL